ncbi:MAG: uracil phosphoribosyltransferase [Myxococcales bacterium]|nr:uracil phosphoribosyltransferase [Myxococcales bacterium]MCB9707973.1 uracil phosphoribosyltransferase [Myxococcales bacterium]
MERNNSLHLISHPLITHKLSLMRDRNTSTRSFRELLKEISMLLAYEVTREMPLIARQIETPLQATNALFLEGKKIVLIPILRAGIGLLDGMLEVIPSARVGHIGLYRDPQSLEAVEYYFKVPKGLSDRDVVVLDPMLATGHSAVAAVRRIRLEQPKSIRYVCLVAAPEGIRHFHAHHPDVSIFTPAVDEKLDDHGYILPGLGDAGDRLFGT